MSLPLSLTSLAAATGVKLTKPQSNLIAKLDNYGVAIACDAEPTSTLTVANPVSGYSADLPVFVAALVLLCYRLMASYERSGTMSFNGHSVPISVYDRTKYLVLALNPSAYQNFID